jgi:glycosyltransferase involved in cell wall biosynthesis
VLYAGRLERQKDPALLIESFGQLHRSDPGAALLVVGAGGQRAAVTERITALGLGDAVRLHDPVERAELAGMMNAADCLLITSAFETGPTIAYEALACGLPVVSTAVGQIPELVQDGVNGEVVRHRDPRAVAAGLQRILSAPADALRAASVRAAEPYRASTVLDALYQDHRKLVG